MPLYRAPSGSTNSSSFDADELYKAWASGDKTAPAVGDDDLFSAIIRTFDLTPDDKYVYHAIASVTLAQVQEAIRHGRKHGLHAWYRDENDNLLEYPPPSDISAYTAIFSPKTTPIKALTAFASNARRGSVRSECASYLQSRRLIPSEIQVGRSKTHINIALDFWVWSCHILEWCGPIPACERVRSSHHILPVFMHHFGCVVPSYESLEIIRQIARDRQVLDIGSGNGYWTYMMRRHGGIKVSAIDSMQSSWRTTWISDTIITDGAKFLKDQRKGAADDVLLLVYPIVGADFTKSMMNAYKGRTVIVAGTQNGNGYTAFKETQLEDWMSSQNQKWQKVVQVALPSFAGKDEALFVFERP